MAAHTPLSSWQMVWAMAKSLDMPITDKLIVTQTTASHLREHSVSGMVIHLNKQNSSPTLFAGAKKSLKKLDMVSSLLT